jgi:phage FluMu protein Com
MMELKVTLDFECCYCAAPIGVTLRCEGKGLAAGLRTVAAVKVPCPTCGAINQLFFEPSGQVRAVARLAAPRPLPEPSLN